MITRVCYSQGWDDLPNQSQLFEAWPDLILETNQLQPTLHREWELHDPEMKSMSLLKQRRADSKNWKKEKKNKSNSKVSLLHCEALELL